MGRRKMPWWGWVLVLTLPVWIVPVLVVMAVWSIVACAVELICDIANWEPPRWTTRPPLG